MKPTKAKPRITGSIESIIDECSKWYHNSTQWHEESWKKGFSCNALIRQEMNVVEAAFTALQEENVELHEYLSEKTRLSIVLRGSWLEAKAKIEELEADLVWQKQSYRTIDNVNARQYTEICSLKLENRKLKEAYGILKDCLEWFSYPFSQYEEIYQTSCHGSSQKGRDALAKAEEVLNA